MKISGTARSLVTAIGAIALVVLPALSGQAQDPITAADFNRPSQDANGWSILTTSTDTRLVYVDPVNGVDTTGTYYSPSAIGGNPQSPNANMTLPFKTISAAYAKTRANMPDWLLLKAGGTFNQSLTMRFGRSPSERAVACAYGTGARPVLQTGTNKGITNLQIANAAVIGIKFYAHTRDPLNPNYVAPTSTSNGDSGFFFTNYNSTWLVRDILIEDCFFDFYTGNGLTNRLSTNPLTNFIMRRCIVSNSYSVATHSSGMGQAQYHGLTVPNMLFQENIFDHNGWIEGGTTGSGATIYNHNIYNQGARGVVFEGNFVLRASSIGTKWTAQTSGSNTYPSDKIVVADNLFAEGEIGISMGANHIGANRFQNVMVRDNVMTDIGRTRPTNRGLSWYMMIQDWQHGNFDGNLMIHQRSPLLSNNAFGILFNADSTAPTSSDDVVVSGNVIADFMGGTATTNALVRFGSGSIMTNTIFANNIVQSPTATPLASISTLGGYDLSGVNVYSSAALPSKHFVKSGTFYDLAAWTAATGDTGASTTPPVFNDPTRDLEHYLPAIGLSGTTFQAFLNAIKGQSKANWNPALTARAVNDWLRAGFNMGGPEPIPGTVQLFAEDFTNGIPNPPWTTVLTTGTQNMSIDASASVLTVSGINSQSNTSGATAYIRRTHNVASAGKPALAGYFDIDFSALNFNHNYLSGQGSLVLFEHWLSSGNRPTMKLTLLYSGYSDNYKFVVDNGIQYFSGGSVTQSVPISTLQTTTPRLRFYYDTLYTQNAGLSWTVDALWTIVNLDTGATVYTLHPVYTGNATNTDWNPFTDTAQVFRYGVISHSIWSGGTLTGELTWNQIYSGAAD